LVRVKKFEPDDVVSFIEVFHRAPRFIELLLTSGRSSVPAKTSNSDRRFPDVPLLVEVLDRVLPKMPSPANAGIATTRIVVMTSVAFKQDFIRVPPA
jgi:hypothetical protein